MTGPRPAGTGLERYGFFGHANPVRYIKLI